MPNPLAREAEISNSAQNKAAARGNLPGKTFPRPADILMDSIT